MRFSRDRRGQSVVVGTVILFGFLIVALSLYQVQVVPQENTNVEYEHSQQVEGEFLDVRNAILSASRTGDGRSTALKLGTRYPQRTFSLNPPPATGQLSTTDSRELRIENATVEGDENVVEYWTNRTATDGAIAFNTSSLRYSPDYNEFRNGPDLVYEHSLVTAEFDSTALGRSGQTAVDADRNRIRLTALDGNVDTSGVERTSLDPEALSQNRRSVRLSSTGGDPIVLELPTDVSTDQAESLEQQWRSRLRLDTDESVSVEGDTVRIRLNGAESYRLELGKVGVGTDTEAPNASTGYITEVSSEGGVAVAEVRDRFNNPVEDADVAISVDGTEIRTNQTDEDGRVSYEVPSGSQEVNLSINGGTNPWEVVTFGNLGGGAGDGDGSDLNPSGPNDVLLSAAYTDSTDNTRAVFRLRNPGTESRTLEQVRLFAYFGPTTGAAGGGSGEIEQRQATVVGTGDVVELRGNFIDLSPNVTIPPGESREVTFDFPETVTGDLIGVSFIDDRGIRSRYLSGIVENSPAQFEVTITDTTSPVEEGEVLDVTATVTNTGSETETQSISLEVAGEVVDTTDVTLDPGQDQSVQLSWTTVAGDAGQYSVTVSSNDGLDQANVEVVAPGQPAGSVNVEEPIIANDGSFDVTTSNYLNLADGFVVVENSRTGSTTSFTIGEATTNVNTADIGGIQAGDEITATLYEDGSQTNELDRNTAVVEQVTYEIVSVNPTAGSGNSINVEFRINTNDPNAEIEVISLQNGNERGSSGRIAVSNDQPQTVTIGGGNQANQVRVILYDESGNEEARVTVPYP